MLQEMDILYKEFVYGAAVGRVWNAFIPTTNNCSFTLHIYLEENISNGNYEESKQFFVEQFS